MPKNCQNYQGGKLAGGKLGKSIMAYIRGLFLRLKVFSMIISVIIKSSYFGLRTQKTGVFNIDLCQNYQGKIDGKIDLDHVLFMPEFHLDKAIDDDIFLTLNLTLTGYYS